MAINTAHRVDKQAEQTVIQKPCAYCQSPSSPTVSAYIPTVTKFMIANPHSARKWKMGKGGADIQEPRERCKGIACALDSRGPTS